MGYRDLRAAFPMWRTPFLSAVAFMWHTFRAHHKYTLYPDGRLYLCECGRSLLAPDRRDRP